MENGSPQRSPQSGFSLVEIMVAAMLGLLLTAAIVKLFVESRQAYRDLDGINEIQENGRFALEFLNHSLRMADHWGGVNGSNVSGSVSMTARGACTATWISQPRWALEGFDGAAAIGDVDELPAACVAAANYVPGSDLIMLRYADPDGVIDDTTLAGATFPVVRTAAGLRGQLLNGGGTPAADLPAGDGTRNYPFRAQLYFVRPCSDPGDNDACGSDDDDGSPIPTLTRLVLAHDGSNMIFTDEALVEGVEQMQVEYGRDTDGDLTADRYDTAATLNALSGVARRTAWEDVVSVRLALLVRSLTADASFADTDTYSLVGDRTTATDGAISVAADSTHYRRKVFTNVVQLRNRSRR